MTEKYERPDVVENLMNGMNGKWKASERVARDSNKNYLVSTVLPADTGGLDEFDPEDIDVAHYKTKREAKKGHKEMVKKWLACEKCLGKGYETGIDDMGEIHEKCSACGV
jgi:hypothetical protein